ncbi:serine protein kinase RIO [Candidatus Woesearchaeota archaeon]|nr:serine protein kinase RIO [Candidatus Woesearchaeota archaeon]
MRITKERFKTRNDVFDARTDRNIFELSSKGHFEEGTLSPVFIGKEANVFSAKTKEGKKIIIKIYRVNTCDFNRMYELLRMDPRYPKLNKNRRKVINSWASREYKNLHRARDAGVSVPTPYLIKENILLMEFIGDDKAADKLNISHDVDKKFFEKVVDNMKKLNKAKLVHGDLSPFNILVYHHEPVFIDFSQAMETDTMRYDEMLTRDIRNIAHFFNKIGISTTEEYIRKKILTK